MRKKKWVVVSLTILLVLVVVPAILFAVFVYNPLEGSVETLDRVIPREMSLVVWKGDVGAEVRSAGSSPVVDSALRRFLASPEWAELDSRFAIQDNLKRIANLEAKAPVTLLDDLLGSEVALAANPSAEGFKESEFLVLTRVSWKVRAAVDLCDSSFVRGRLDPSVEISTDDRTGIHAVQVQAGPKAHRFYFARVKDVLGVSNRPEIVEGFVSLGRGGGGLSLAFSDGYSRPAEAAGEAMSPVNVFFSLTKGAERLRLQNFWQQFETGLMSRVLIEALGARFLDRLTGSVYLADPPHARARLSFGREVLSQHEKRILTREPVDVKEAVAALAALVLKDSMLFGLIHSDPRTLFGIITTSLSDSERRLIDDALAKTEFKTLDAFLDRTSGQFGNELAIVLSRRDLSKLSVKQKANPLPAVTLLWRTGPDPASLQAFLKKIEDERFAVDDPKDETVGGITVRAAYSKLDASKIGYGVIGDVFFFTNAFDAVLRIAEARRDPQSSLAGDPQFQTCLSRLSDKANVLAYVDGASFLDWAEDYKTKLANDLTEIPVSQWIVLRGRFREEIMRERGQGIGPDELQQLEDQRANLEEKNRREKIVPATVERLARQIDWLRAVRSVGLSLRSEKEDVEGRAVLLLEPPAQ